MENIHETTLNRTRIHAKLLCIFVFIFVWFSVLPSIARAATLYFSPSYGSYNIGQTFSVSVYVSSADQTMNAASGVISFPKDNLEVISLSKTGSIFNLWVQEPSFSNSLGTINFEGIVLNPGFIGNSGKIITVNFKTKAAGNVTITFSTASVLANDGNGTNILSNFGNANFLIKEAYVSESESNTSPNNTETTSPSPISQLQGAPEGPKIFSPTHPDENKWYSNPNPKFIWELPTDITAVRILYSRESDSKPGIVYSPAISEKQLENMKDGIWYFHAQFKNKIGWGKISHFRFQIDTQPPKPFEIQIKEGEKTTNPQPTLSFETTDDTSGIDYYEIIIDNGNPIRTDKPEYKIAPQDLGKHTIIVKAVDKAGNKTLSMTELEILPIEAPTITDYPKELLPESTLSIKGTSLPEATVKIYIQKDNEEIKVDGTKSNEKGEWTYTDLEPVEKGVYKIWAETIDNNGAKSKPSEKVTVLVNPPVFIRIGKLAIDYLNTIVGLLFIILIIILGIIWFWRKIRESKRKIKKEVSEAEKILYQAFKSLKEEIEKQVATLDGRPDLSEKERKLCDNLKEALKKSEEIIEKEIEDIEKEIDK